MAAKNEHLPGMKPKVVKDISDAAEKYVDARDKRIKMLAKEVELKGLLADAMHKNKLTQYRNEDLFVELIPGVEKLKVKSIDDLEPED